MDNLKFENLLNLKIDSDKIKILERILENKNPFNPNGFRQNNDGVETPVPKSQNHLNSINNSAETQQSIQNILDKLNKK